MSRRPSRSTLSAVAAVALGLSGAVLLGTAFTRAAPAPSTEPPAPSGASGQPTGQPTREATGKATEKATPGRSSAGGRAGRPPSGTGNARGLPDEVAGPVLPRSEPVRLAVPRIGVTSSVVDLGLDPTGAMEVPEDGARAGWYSRGPAPGSLGPAVIAGHVDWEGSPAVFYRLGELRAGDRVLVSREDGTTAVFAVTQVATYPKDRFPTRAVFGSSDHAGLRLVTCGGAFDRAAGHYVDNVVAFARLVRG